MIFLIYHGDGWVWPRVYQGIAPIKCERVCIRDERYALGMEPPRYPVPVLITDVDWWIETPQAVVLWTLGPSVGMWPWYEIFLWSEE